MIENFEMPDRNFNTRHIEVVFDHDTKTFVAAIRSGQYHRMMDGSMRQMVTATGESAEGSAEAAAKAVAELNDTVAAGESIRRDALARSQ